MGFGLEPLGRSGVFRLYGSVGRYGVNGFAYGWGYRLPFYDDMARLRAVYFPKQARVLENDNERDGQIRDDGI